MAYIYLIGTGVYAVFWLMFYLYRKDLRKKLWLSSILAAPLGITEMLFKDYWSPQFNVIQIAEHLYLEDILFCFFLGGVVAVMYQVLFEKREIDISGMNLLPTIVVPLSIAYYLIAPTGYMFYMLFFFVVGCSMMLFQANVQTRKDLLLSGFFNLLFYSFLFGSLWFVFLSLRTSYHFENLWGAYIFTIPIEEFLWVLFFGIFWTPIYEIINKRKITLKYFRRKY